MKTTPPSFRRVCIALVMSIAAPWASGQLVQTLADINTTPVAPATLPDEMKLAGGTLFISTDDALAGTELWKYNVLAKFQGSRGVAVDTAGNLYVADTPNHVIRKVTPAGLVTTLAGTVGVTGNVDGSGLAARFNSPQGIAVVNTGPNAGLIFVADTGNHTIRRITAEGIVTTLAGDTTGSGLNRVGVPGYVNSLTDAQQALFRSPRGIAVRPLTGSNLQIWVSDSGNNVIRRVDISGAVVSAATFVGRGTNLQNMPPNGEGAAAGWFDGAGDAVMFNNPGGIALDLFVDPVTGSPTLYVADTGNNRIRRVGLDGNVTTLAGSGAAGSNNAIGAAATFNAPQGVVCDSGSPVTAANVVVFVADTGNHLIRRIQASTRVVTTLAGTTGTAGSTDATTGTAASFSAPQGVGFLRQGTTLELTVADTGNHTLRKVVVPSGVTTLRAGQTGQPGSLDGAATGTATASPVQIKDILPGEGSGAPEQLTAVGSKVFFSAEGEAGDRDLWVSDGTSLGTLRIGGTTYANDPPGPMHLTAVGDTLFFQGYSFENGAELWKSNGLAADGPVPGTVRVKDIYPDEDSSLLEGFFNAGGTLLFGASTVVPATQETPASTTGVELWKSQGASTGADTVQVKELFTGSTSSFPSGYTLFNDFYYFAATSDFVSASLTVGRELFRLPKSLAIPASVSDMFVADLDGLGDSEPRNMTVSGPNLSANGGQLFFSASTLSTGRELYVINADNGNTPTPVVDLNSSEQDSGIDHLTPITTIIDGNQARPNRVLFTGDSNNNQGLELYISDGTAVGTNQVKDITPGEDSSVLDNFFAVSTGLVVFTKQESDESITLWRTDGTDSGTFQIDDFKSEGATGDSATAKDFRAPVLVGTNLYFMLSDDELWRTNGLSDLGTVKLHNFRTSTESSGSQNFTKMSDGRVIFSAFTADEGREPWISNLSTSTALLADLQEGTLGSEPENFTATTDGRVFFTAEDVVGNRELYVTNGTTTRKVGEINEFAGSEPQNLFWGNGKLYFSARSTGQDSEVWVASGADGAETLSTIVVNSSESGSFPDNFITYKNRVYFSAETGAGVELWRTEESGLTVVGTVPFMDIAVGTQSSDPDEMVVFPKPSAPTFSDAGSKLYFIATGSGNGATQAQETGRELWVTDGSAAGTKVVKDIVAGGVGSISNSFPAYLTVVGNLMYFVADDGINGRELWKSDGTPGGTVMVSNINKVVDFGTATFGSNPTELRNVNGKLFFLADDGVNGRELYTSTGTAVSTVMVSLPNRTGFVTGAGDGGIQDMVVFKDVLTFTADDGINGREVWISDGTTAGTNLLTEFVVGGGSSYPHSLAAADSQLVFSASDVLIGDEPRQAFLAPEFVVERTPSEDDLANNSTVDFTPVEPVVYTTSATTGYVEVTLRLRNLGAIGIYQIAASISGLHAADFVIQTTPKLATVISKDGSTDLKIRFKPKEGGERTATLVITSSDAAHSPFTLTLSGDSTKDPTVGTHPISQIVKVGAPVTMTATTSAGTNPITLKWRKNASPVAGAISNPFYLWAAKLTDGGAYTAEFKSATGGSAITNTAQLGVVEDFTPARVLLLKVGTKSTKLTVNATGNSLTYLWKRSATANLGSPETLPAAFTDAGTKTLTFPKAAQGVQVSDSGYYFCEVTSPAGTVIGGTTHVKVYNATPVISPAPTLPVGIVGSAYFHQLAVDPDPAKAATTFGVKAVAPSKLLLQPGLKLDAKTGIISGVPTAADSRLLAFTASNGIPTATSVSTTQATLTVVAMPTGLEGVYQGLVERNEEINGSAGGRIEITPTMTGSYSGKIIMGPTTYAFKGNLSFGLDAGLAAPPYTGMVRIPRAGILAPLDLSFTIEPNAKNTLSAGQITSVNVGGPVTAEVYAWKVTTNTARYLGVHNFGIKLPATVNSAPNPNLGDDNLTVPQGNGYGSFKVDTKGVLTIAGMTADGEKITCATHVGPNGEVLLYQSLYTTARKGAIAGLLTLGTGTLLDSPNDNIITANSEFDFDWTRPPAPALIGAATNTRTYRAGFGLADTPVTTPVELEAFGGYYQYGTHLLQVVNASTTADNASLTFTGAGVDLASLDPDAPHVSVNLSTAKVPTTPLPGHPAKTKFTKTDLKTGVFTGSFALADDDITTIPKPPALPKSDELKRAVNFLGLIVPVTTDAPQNHQGVGYFMLQQIPPAEGATPYKTAPILSGKVLFDND